MFRGHCWTHEYEKIFQKKNIFLIFKKCIQLPKSESQPCKSASYGKKEPNGWGEIVRCFDQMANSTKPFTFYNSAFDLEQV